MYYYGNSYGYGNNCCGQQATPYMVNGGGYGCGSGGFAIILVLFILLIIILGAKNVV